MHPEYLRYQGRGTSTTSGACGAALFLVEVGLLHEVSLLKDMAKIRDLELAASAAVLSTQRHLMI